MARSRAYWIFLLMSGLTQLANATMFTTYAVYYIQGARMNPLQLVLVGTALEATCFLFEIPTGVVADTYSRRLSVIIGMFILGSAYLMEGSLPFFGAIVAAEIIRGVGETFVSGAREAWIADEVGEERVGMVFQRAAQMERAAGMVGIVLSVALASIRLNLPYQVGGVLYLLTGILLVCLMPEQGFQPAPRSGRATWQALAQTWQQGARTVRVRPILLTILGIGFFIGTASEGYDRLCEAHFLKDFPFPALGAWKPVVWFGILNMATSLLGLMVTAVFQRRLDAISRVPVANAKALMLFNTLTVGCILGFALAGNFWMAFVLALLKSVIGSVLYPLYGTWLVQNIDPKVRATVLSMSSQTNALGQVAGGPIVGWVGAAASIRAAIAVSGLLLAPATALYASALRHHRAEELVETC